MVLLCPASLPFPPCRKSHAKLQELLSGHQRFVQQQLANKKASRVLDTAFGSEWREAYMGKVSGAMKPREKG